MTLAHEMLRKTPGLDFRGGPVAKNLPSNTGDVSLKLHQEAKIPHAAGQQLSPQLLSLPTLEPELHNKRPSHHN